MRRLRGPVGLVCLLLAVAAAVGRPASGQQRSLPRILAWADALRGTEEEELRWPVAVAVSPAGEIALADAFGPRLLRFRKVGVSWQLDRAVPLPAPPSSLAHDGERFVATLRRSGGLVAFEGPELAARSIPLPRGTVAGALAALPGGDLLVHDPGGRRLLRLSAAGTVARELELEGRVTALAARPTGGFVVALADQGSLLIFGADWRLEQRLELPADGPVPPWPAAVVVEPDGQLLVVDRHSGRILVLDPLGRPVGVGSRQGWDLGLLLYPAGIARLPDGALVVADLGNGRAQLFVRTDRGS